MASIQRGIILCDVVVEILYNEIKANYSLIFVENGRFVVHVCFCFCY